MIEQKITALLRTICPRAYTDFAPVETQRPYVTYQQIGGETMDFIDNSLPNKENADIQINVWADTRIEAKSLIKRIEEAMLASTELQASASAAAVSDYDADIPVYGSRQDFSVWADR